MTGSISENISEVCKLDLNGNVHGSMKLSEEEITITISNMTNTVIYISRDQAIQHSHHLLLSFFTY